MAVMRHWCDLCGRVVSSKATFGGTDAQGRRVVALWTDSAGHTVVIAS